MCLTIVQTYAWWPQPFVTHPSKLSSSHISLSQEYSHPSCFQEDLFALVGEKRRPPHKWLVIGPARSGSGLHIDPLATHAWNAVLHGHKRWALFPPDTPRQVHCLRCTGALLDAVAQR